MSPTSSLWSRPELHASLLGAVVARVHSLDAGGTPVLDQHLLGAAADDELGAVLERVEEEGAVARHLRPRLLAEAEVAGVLGGVPLGVGVADDRLEVPAERLAALLHALLRPVQVAATVVRVNALEHGVEV